MKYIKKIILVLLSVTPFIHAFGQTLKTEEDVYTVLKANVLGLDKVEGLFRCTSYSQMPNQQPVKQPVAPKKVVIVQDNGTYNAFWIVENTREVYQKAFMQITKREYINTYDVKISDWAPREVEFIDDNSFKIKKEKPKGKADDGSVESYIFEKIFPTQADIDKANADNPKAGKCSGFLINGNLIVTNLHVVEKAKSIKIKGVKGDFSTTYNAVLKQSDKNNDLAVLSFEDATIKLPCSVTLAQSAPDVGKDIFVLAYPLTAATGNEVKLTNGIVSAKTGYKGDVASYQINVPMQGGNIGGPVFDKTGAVVGIIGTSRDAAETSSYCVKSGYLKNLVDALPEKVKLPAVNSLAAKPLTEKVKALNKFVYIVEVEY